MEGKEFYRDSWIEVDLDHIAFNIKQLRNRLSKRTGIYAVVKADGYGHGDIQVAKKALQSGAEGLTVALLDEALKLRRAGITAPILVMGWIRPEDAPIAASYNITVTFFQREWLKQVKASGFSGDLKVHMKWDTGMGRVGIRTVHELEEVLEEIRGSSLLLEGVYTHFATADEAEETYFRKQQSQFNLLMEAFKSLWPYEVIIHTGNSAASMRFPEDMQHYVRFGISMYGLYPSQVVKKEKPIQLKPALSLHSQLIHVKKMDAGESISYGCTYKAKKDEWIGTVPIGYADGILRKLQGMHVLVGGEYATIVGRICMDQLMIRLNRRYEVGTKVTIIGEQGNNRISMDDLAYKLDTINYEIACMLTGRIPRLYFNE